MHFSLSYIQSKVSDPIFFWVTYGGASTCRNFEENDLSYEEWKSVLHLSTRWNFDSIRKLALSSIEPPTSHDRLVLARTYLIDDWVVPALSALCERTKPLTLSEAHQMNIEDVVLISTVREHIRGRTIQVDAAEIPRRVEAEQLTALGHRISLSPSRELEDNNPVAGAWHFRSRREKAEAEARARAQEATRLCLDAEAKEHAEAVKKSRMGAEERAHLEAEKAREDAEEEARLEVEERKRKGAEEKALAKKARKAAIEAEKKREAEAKAKAAEAEKMRREAEAKAKEEAEAKAKAEEARIKANDDTVNKVRREEEATQWRGRRRVDEQEKAETGWLSSY